MSSLLGTPSAHARPQFMVTLSFLEGRLAQRQSFEWALGLRPTEIGERQAIAHLLDHSDGKQLKEPWRSAWRLLEEDWAYEDNDVYASIHGVRPLIVAGDLSGSTIEKIVRLVRPRITLSPASRRWGSNRRHPERPRRVSDLVIALMDSGPIVNPAKLGLDQIEDVAGLNELGHSLEAAVQYGMGLGQRIGWAPGIGFWRLGSLHRVYYVSPVDGDQDAEPDRFHKGIAPAVKLLYAVVDRLAVVDLEAAKRFADAWRANSSDIHRRLWAAIARAPSMASGNEVGEFLLGLDQNRFWDMNGFPEIAELRARRFADLPSASQRKIARRLLSGPPRSFWPRKTEPEEVAGFRANWIGQEIRRIQLAGADLPKDLAQYLQDQMVRSPFLKRMWAVDDRFMESPRAKWVPPRPDRVLDTLSGKERLDAIERALTSARRGFDDDPPQQAIDWIREARNADAVLGDFESVGEDAALYPAVWDMFGSQHRRDGCPDTSQIANRTINLLLQLPDATIERAIDGLAHWLSRWGDEVSQHSRRYELWAKLWPVAAATTNAQQPPEEEPDLNVVVRSNAGEPMDLDALNTPAGHMIGMFLAACPNLGAIPHPFGLYDDLRRMRDSAVAVGGRSKLIALHRMIECLPYFLNADQEWVQVHLIAPLKADDSGAAALWRAVSRRLLTREVLEILGAEITKRVIDVRLGRESRKALIWSLVVEAIQAKWNDREPAVAFSDVQQALRSVEDEVRAHAAGVVRRFVVDMSANRDPSEQRPTVEKLFRQAGLPFLESVWPQERSVTTPGVASAFASLPAECGDAFVEAVRAIERFLVPFECWSMLEFGLYGRDGDELRLSHVNTADKANALVALLDACIGTAEGAVVPYDLDKVLAHIRSVAPALGSEHRFRRLATLARR